MTDRKIENVLREALEAEPPAAVDLSLRAAIGLEAASRRHRRQTLLSFGAVVFSLYLLRLELPYGVLYCLYVVF